MKKTLLSIAVILITALSSVAQLSNMNPNQGIYQQTLITTITGTGIFIQSGSPSGNLFEIKLTQGVNQITLFDYWNAWMYNVNVTSNTTVDAEFTIPLSVPSGLYDLSVTIGDVWNPWNNQFTYTLPGAFTVGTPDGYVEGNVFHDLNENGVKDVGEPGLANRTVHLMPNNYNVITDVNGDYSFPVMNGSYNVNFVNNTSDYVFVTLVNDTISVTISNNTSSGNNFGIKNALTSITPDFGMQASASLHTLVSSEPIFQTGGNPYGNVTGMYVFSTPGINVPHTTAVTVIDPYTIEATISVPSGIAIADSIDIRVSVSGAYSGNHFLRQKFQINPPDGYVQGQVYDDLNKNGIKDVGEPGVANVPVKLMPTNLTSNTDISGNYSIAAANGNYTVTVLALASNYMFPTSQDTLSVIINSGNSTGNDFGLKSALVSITPNIAYAGLTLTHQIVADEPIFIPGGSPQGNITQVRIYSTPSFFVNVNSNVTIIDSVTVQIVIPVPVGTTLGNNIDLSIYTSTGFVGYHYLKGQLDIVPAPAYISGRLFYDSDQDKINDPTEPGIYNGKVKLMPDNTFAFSDLSGNFSIASLGGVQTLTYENNLVNLVLFTDSTSYTFNATGNVTGNDFGFLTIYPDYDLSVSLPYTARRCSSEQFTTFKLTNISNIAYDAVAWLHHSSNMAFVSSAFPPTSISNDTLYWNLTNLQPYAFVNFSPKFLLPGAGDTIHLTSGGYSLDAGGAIQLTDQVSQSYVITCAWDPNDKGVTPPGVFAQNFTLMSDTLEYLIRFQNTGNDTAFNVVVLDTLDSDLDYNTFEILGSSHSVQTELQSNGAVRFAFNNILLPDSNINEPESHGYVRYRILADAGLSDSTEVTNTAHIFFDFNPDVITNTTLNTLVFVIPVGVGELISDDEKVVFYPNPLSHSATLLFENPSAEKYSLTLTAITGNKIAADRFTNGNNFVIEKGKMPKGIYFYNLTNTVTNKMHSGKFVVE